MADDELSFDEVQSLLEPTKRERHNEKRESWFGPDEMDAIREAIQEDQNVVVLKGREFKIKYSAKWEAYNVSPVRGFIPSGWFAL